MNDLLNFSVRSDKSLNIFTLRNFSATATNLFDRPTRSETQSKSTKGGTVAVCHGC